MGSCFAKWSCDYAESQIDYTEGPNNWNKFAAELDDINYYEGCGKKQNLPWCCSYVNACILHGCTTNTDPKWTAYYVMYQRTPNLSAVVSYMADYFKDNDAYFTDTQDLERGDIVFFQNDDGLCHVGICVDWDDDGFYTCEGNKGDAVQKCFYRYGEVGGYVAGFGRPRYDAWDEETSEKEPDNQKEDPKPTPEPEPEPTPEPKVQLYRVRTNGSPLRLRSAPNTDSACLGLIPNGTVIAVSGMVQGEMINWNEDWARTTYDGMVGYCSANYLEEE